MKIDWHRLPLVLTIIWLTSYTSLEGMQKYLRGNELLTLYNTGVIELQNNNPAGLEKFRTIAESGMPASMKEYMAKIGALEVLLLDAERNSNYAMQERFATKLVKAYNEAFALAKVSNDKDDTKKQIPLANILLSMYDNKGRYQNLSGIDRHIRITKNISDYLHKNRPDYLQCAGKTKELELHNLDAAISLVPQALVDFTEAQNINDADRSALERKNLLYQNAFQALLKASTITSDIPNVEYHLALMYLYGLGTQRDDKLAQKHIHQAFASRNNAPENLKLDIEELKKAIDALLLWQEGVEHYTNQLKEAAFNAFERASQLFPNFFDVEIALAEMFFRGEGTQQDLRRAKGHAKLALNLTADDEKRQHVRNLIKEIDALGMALTEGSRVKGTDYDNKRALSRVLGKDASKTQFAIPTEPKDDDDWFPRLFGTSKPLATTAPVCKDEPEAGSSIASSSKTSSPVKPRQPSGFGLSLFFGKSKDK